MDTPPQDPQASQPITEVRVGWESDTPEPSQSVEPRHFIAPALSALASLLTLIGCFQPLVRVVEPLGWAAGADGGQIANVQDAWTYELSFLTEQSLATEQTLVQPAPPVGIPLILAAMVLLAAVIAGVRSAAMRTTSTFARWLASASAVFLAGVVMTVGMLGFKRSATMVSQSSTVTIEAGMWLLIAALVSAAASAIAIHLLAPRSRPVSPEADLVADMVTPKEGFSVTVLPPDSPPLGAEFVQPTDTPSPPLPSGPPDYSAFAPPPDPGSKERD